MRSPRISSSSLSRLVRKTFVMLALALVGAVPGSTGPAAPTSTSALVADASHRVEGAVLDLGGAPLRGARVMAHIPRPTASFFHALLTEEDEPPPFAETSSNEHGRFVLELPTGLYRIELEAPGHVALVRHQLAVTGPTILPTAVLGPAVEARLEVLDHRGAPLAGVPVVLFPSRHDDTTKLWARHRRDGWRPPARWGWTDARGTFLDRRLDGEWLDIHLWPAGRSTPFTIRDVEGARLLLEDPASRRARLRVRDALGRPATGVLVAVGERPWPAGITDSRGELVLELTGGTALDLWLATPRGILEHASLKPAAEMELRLPVARPLRGRALTADGPMAGALVWTGNDPGTHTRTDADGRFELWPGEATGWVRAMAPEHRLAELSWDDAPPRRPIELVLDRAPTLAAEGRVLDLESRPLAGATVALRAATTAPWPRPADTPTPWRATTDTQGRFVFPYLPPGELDLWAVAPGHAPFLVRGVIPAADGPGQTTADGSAVEASMIDLGSLVLEPTTSISGRVLDSAGESVAEPALWVFTDDSRGRLLRPHELRRQENAATGDADGRFTLEGLTQGRRLDLVAHAPGYAPTVLRALVPPLERPVELVLPRATTLAGRVEGPNGRPIAEAGVELWPEEPVAGRVAERALDDGDARMTLSDHLGRFELDDIRPGRYRLSASAEGWAPSEPRAFELASHAASEETVIVLEPGAVLNGRVSNADGEPLAGVRIEAGPARAHSGIEGNYRLAGIAPGRQTIEAHHPLYGRWARQLELTVGEQPLDIDFPPTLPLRGEVIDHQGEPVSGATITLSAERWRDLRSLGATSEASGAFEFPQVSAGEYSLTVTKKGYAARRPRQTLRIEDEPIEDLLLRLYPATRVSGRLIGLEPDQLLDAAVEARSDDRRTAGRISVDGRYRVSGLAPGAWTLVASTETGGRQTRETVWIEPGEREIERDLRFETGLRLEGLVIDGENPLVDAGVWLRGRDVADERRRRTDHQGRFVAEDLEPGSYLLAVSDARRAITHHQELDLHGDRQVVVEIATARLGGRITSRGEPLADALVTFRALLGERTASVTTVGSGRDGRFVIERLTAGPYRVSVSKAGYETIADQVDVTAGSEREGLDYDLVPATALELHIRSSQGAVPPWAAVSMLAPSGEVRLLEQQPLDADGSALFTTLPAGELEVLVWAESLVPRRLRLTLPSEPRTVILDEAGWLDLRVAGLAEPSSVGWVTVLDATGHAIEAVDPLNGEPVSRWRMEAGRVRISNLPGGTSRVEIRGPGGGRWSAELTLVPRATTLLRLD